jgi:hypothetical protein
MAASLFKERASGGRPAYEIDLPGGGKQPCRTMIRTHRRRAGGVASAPGCSNQLAETGDPGEDQHPGWHSFNQIAISGGSQRILSVCLMIPRSVPLIRQAYPVMILLA